MNESALYASIDIELFWCVGVFMFSNSCFFVCWLRVFLIILFGVFFDSEWICASLVFSYHIVECLRQRIKFVCLE